MLLAALVGAAGCGHGSVESGPDASADSGRGGDAAGESTPGFEYEPHTILEVPTVVDVDGHPDIADPHVIKVGDTWFLYATQTKSNLEVWTSNDLKTWDNGGVGDGQFKYADSSTPVSFSQDGKLLLDVPQP